MIMKEYRVWLSFDDKKKDLALLRVLCEQGLNYSVEEVVL